MIRTAPIAPTPPPLPEAAATPVQRMASDLLDLRGGARGSVEREDLLLRDWSGEEIDALFADARKLALKTGTRQAHA